MLIEISAGEAASRVVDGHLGVGVGDEAGARMVSQCMYECTVLVLGVEGEVAHPDQR